MTRETVTIDTHKQDPPKVKTVLKSYKNQIAVVKLQEPIYGGMYAVVSDHKMTTGLSLEAANSLFRTLKMLTI